MSDDVMREDEEEDDGYTPPDPPNVLRFTMRVGASSVHVLSIEGDYHIGRPKPHTSSIITLEGTAEPSALPGVCQAELTIYEGDGPQGGLGAAVGGSTVWSIVCYLNAPQFSHVLHLANTSRLHTVKMEFQNMERGSQGPLRLICFRTLPLPSETLSEIAGQSTM